MTATCASCGLEAIATCERCGAFTCGACLVPGQPFCAPCGARPEWRLRASPRAVRALLWSVLGLHGLVPLLPLALRHAWLELAAIAQGRAPLGGQPYARAAQWIAGAGCVLWLGVAIWWWS